MKTCSFCTSPKACKREGKCFANSRSGVVEVLHGEIMAPALDLDPGRLKQLADKFFHVVNDHYVTSPIGPMTVCEVLNALAVVAGSVIRGTRGGPGESGEQFFRDALDINLKGD